jgi:predicted DNA-binding transcriptional regulator AlpA
MERKNVITLDLSPIIEAVKLTFLQEIKSLKEELVLTQNQESKFLKRKEVLQMLGISPPTLSRWVNDGIIKQHKVGSRVYFVQKEIESIILKNSSSC